MKKIAILGMGSAGILSTCHMLTWLKNWQITNIHDPETPILGIGESTNPSFVTALEYATDLNLYDVFKNKDLDATIKYGTLYIDWRENEFINPLLGSGVAIHMNTYKLKEFCLPKIKQKWGNKFNEVQGKITDITQNENFVSIVVNDEIQIFDYVIDCRGFPETYDDYTIVENPTNHCLIHNIKTGADWGSTKHIATKDGWMFVVPLTTRQSYGYLFNDKITDVADAKENFSKQIDVPLEDLDNIEYKFKSYYSPKIIEGRIIKNGNRAVFFEPMFANSLWLYREINSYIIDLLTEQYDAETLNDAFKMRAKEVEEMICFQYQGGSLYDSEFWSHAKKYCSEKILKSEILPIFEKEFKEMGQNNYHRQHLNWAYSMNSLLLVDKNFGYNYFNKYYNS